MKKRKLLLLTAAILCLLLAVTACGEKDPSGDSILDFFAPDTEQATMLSKVTDIDGEVVAYDPENNLIAVDRDYLHSSNPEYRSIYIYNFSDGDIEREYCYSTGTYTVDGNREFEIEFQYPMFRVTEITYGTDSDNNPTEKRQYSYYFFDGYTSTKSIVYGVDEEDDTGFSVEMVNNLYVCKVNGKVYWVNSDLKTLREFNAFTTEDYEYQLPEFYAEYKGYLYTHEFDMVSRRVQVFNKEGVCQVLYSHPSNTGFANVFVLNDGNVFIQEQLIVEDGEEYDLRELSSTEDGVVYVKLKVVSKILNFKTGEVTELDLDYMVDFLNSAYDMKHGNDYGGTSIADTRNNVASITRFANGSLASVSSVVVLDNLMNIEYTMPNIGVNTEYSYIFTNGNYIIGERAAKENRFYLYNEYGEKLATLPENFHPEMGIYGDYVVAGSIVYDSLMNKLLDLETSPAVLNFGGRIDYIFLLGEKLCFVFEDELTDEKVYFVLDDVQKELVPIAPGDSEEFWTWSDDEEDAFFYFVYDEENENETLYALDGTALLRVQDAEWIDCIEMNGIVILMAEVNGESVCYIVG